MKSVWCVNSCRHCLLENSAFVNSHYGWIACTAYRYTYCDMHCFLSLKRRNQLFATSAQNDARSPKQREMEREEWVPGVELCKQEHASITINNERIDMKISILLDLSDTYICVIARHLLYPLHLFSFESLRSFPLSFSLSQSYSSHSFAIHIRIMRFACSVLKVSVIKIDVFSECCTPLTSLCVVHIHCIAIHMPSSPISVIV